MRERRIEPGEMVPSPLPSVIVNEKDGSELVLIPAGRYWIGSPKSDRRRFGDEQRHPVYLPAFYIAKYAVTVAQFRTFLKRRRPRYRYVGDREDWSGPDHPVVKVSWYDARAYCEWAGLRLPTEAEWEAAARGRVGRSYQPYPWGDRLTGDRCRWDAEGTAPVQEFASGATRWGEQLLYQMIGNVWEWTSSLFADHPCVLLLSALLAGPPPAPTDIPRMQPSVKPRLSPAGSPGSAP